MITTTRIALTLALSLSVVGSACSFEADSASRSHRHDREIELPPEVPRIPSRPLVHVRHGTLERAAPRFLQRVDGPRRITQRVLLLGATGEEPSYHAARDALVRIGVPFDTVIASQQEVTDAMLTDGVSTCHFNAVVFATSGLGYVDSLGTWSSALSAEEWARIADFERACSAREAVWYAWPSVDLGLSFVSAFGAGEQVDGLVREPSFFRWVRSDARIPYRNAYGYRAAIVDPATTRALVEDSAGGVLLARHTTADGRELVVSTVDANPYLLHSLALEYDMIRWLTRGLFIGKKRAYLSPQIDDLFIDNDMWIAGVGNLGTEQFRLSGQDLTTFVGAQAAFRARLPSGSTFVTDMALNGIGTRRAEYDDTALLTAARNAGDQLTWLNHTWDHENMDLMTRRQARREVARNCNRALNLELNGFSCIDLVTPDVSGLTNLRAVRGIIDAGARYVVSDTSITETIRPDSPGTNPSFNVGRTSALDARLYQVPRHPTNVFYDVSSPETETDEYNTIYRSYFGYDLTYEQVLDNSSAFGALYLFQGDLDPLMFHQANLADYGGGRSLYGDFIDAVADKFLAVSDAPILTLSMEDLGLAMKSRGQLEGCNATATVVETLTGAVLELASSAECTVPVTGLAAQLLGTVENYAGETTTLVVMPAGGGVVTAPMP